MNELIVSKNESTMSTIEIAELTGKRHDHVLRDTRNMLIELYSEGVTNFGDTYIHPQNNEEYKIYRLPKREALILTTGYSIIQRAAIIDRWQELEAKQSPALPNYQEALRQLADQLDITQKQAILIKIQQPAVDFVDRYVEAKSSKCLSDVAKLLKHKPQAFFKLLADNDVIFKRGGSWVPYQRHIDIGRFTVTTGVSNGHAYDQTRVEPDGIVWLAKMFPA